jgi:hypothetical protein
VDGLTPVLTDLDNAWCGATFAPAGCTADQSVFGRRGLEATADAALVNSLSDAFGAPLGGRFRNVYAPPLYASIEDVVVSHADLQGRYAGLGIVLDPRQVNTALRHLAQGTSTTRTTNGLLDQSAQLAGIGIAARPEVAPALLGIPRPDLQVSPDPSIPGGAGIPGQDLAMVVAPDLRVDVTTAPGTPPIRFTASVTAQIAAGWNAIVASEGGPLSRELDRVGRQHLAGRVPVQPWLFFFDPS